MHLCKITTKLLIGAVVFLLCAIPAFTQTSNFTYQGRLTDGGTSANGNYDLQFALFDSLSGGAQVGSTQTLNTVAVSNGVFTVGLDFGASAFNGAARFLEISARPSGGGSFTLLSPRQQITSTPYAVRSLNASSADSVPASGVPAGSGNYVQNSSSPQASSNFNISGDGNAGGTLTGNVVNAATQYNLRGFRILGAAGLFNLIAGLNAGANNTGAQNSFFGSHAGEANTTGSNNSFFGDLAGVSNTNGSENSYFGDLAGLNATGSANSFFGSNAGSSNNNAGRNNAFFGRNAGQGNSTGNANAFFGDASGAGVTTGNRNTFIGSDSGASASTSQGDFNTLLGAQAMVTSGPIFNPNNATAIGARAQVDNSNSLVLGSIKGINGASADTSVGIGTTAPLAKLHVMGGFANIGSALFDFPAGAIRVTKTTGQLSNEDLTIWNNGGSGGQPFAITGWNTGNGIYINTSTGNVGIGINSPARVLDVNGRARIGSIPLESSSGSVCFNASGDLLRCGASSLRFKTNVNPFVNGLDVVRRLRPISFTWKEDGRPDIGLAAEEVAKVAPSLTFTDDKGAVTGVKYERLNLLLINAIKEQQTQIQTQQQQIAGLKKLVCRSHRRAAVCK